MAAVAAVLLIIVVVLLIIVIPIIGLKAEKIAAPAQNGISAATGTLDNETGEVKVAASENRELYINTKTCDIFVVDTATGTKWNATYQKAGTTLEKALLSVSFLGEDNSLTEWDSYKYCVALGTYTINTIENGLQIIMDINEGESFRLYEHMPQKMSSDRYNNFFIAGLDRLVEEGTLESATAEKYKNTMELIYAKSSTEDCYTVNYVGTPPNSAVKQLIEISKITGYTAEMLLEDCEAFNIVNAITEVAQFEIILEAVLDGDDFVVTIPTYAITRGNEYFVVQNIKVLPNFSLTTINEAEEGYLFVPDGSGALIKMFDYDPNISDYKQDVYDNTYFKDYYFAPEFSETITMPVFGMLRGALNDTSSGFLGIIETGAESSYVTAKTGALTTDTGGNPYNKVFASVDLVQTNSLKVFGPYSSQSATFLVKTDYNEIDYTIRYKLYTAGVGYYELAWGYRDYLMEEAGITELAYEEEQKLYLNVIGTVSFTEHFLGIPYFTENSMTDYNELTQILQSLDDVNKVVEYSGALNNGLYNSISSHAKLVGSNGSSDEFKALMSYADSTGTDIFFGINLAKIYQNGNGFYSFTGAVHNYYNEAITLYSYDYSDGRFRGTSNIYTLLSPRYLTSVIDSFIKDSDEIKNIAVQDLADIYYADCNTSNMVSGIQANTIVKNGLAKLGETKSLSLTNPRADKITYGEYATDISRKSSDYNSFYVTIPFRQLVMNGLVEYTTENINMSSESSDYYLLQILELGSIPKYTITYESSDLFINSTYSYLYSTEFAVWQDSIRDMYETAAMLRGQLGSTEIISHKMLNSNVFITEYEHGSVIVNYNRYEVETEYGILPALGYMIIDGNN